MVSYDLSYGPGDMIENGHTGYLVPAGDEQALAVRAVQILNDPGLRDRFGAASLVAVERYSPEAYLARWSDLFNRIAAKGWR